MGSVPIGNQNQWTPYTTYRDCSQGICSIYCPQWCYIIYPPPPPSPSFTTQNDYNNFNNSSSDFSPLIIAIIGILATAFILITYYTVISKYCWRRSSDGSNNSTDQDVNQIGTEENNQEWRNGRSGLHESVIKSITVFKYKKNDGFIEGTDCSVCLSEFEENESLRLLPMCTHAFHVPCIDTWLKSHGSCPLCRANVDSSAPKTTASGTATITTPPPPPPSQTTITMHEPNSHVGTTTTNVVTNEYQQHGSTIVPVLLLQDAIVVSIDVLGNDDDHVETTTMMTIKD